MKTVTNRNDGKMSMNFFNLKIIKRDGRENYYGKQK
jgi:hypothetical protein